MATDKLHVAETFATTRCAEQMGSVTKAINAMGDRIEKRLDGITDRMSRVIEASHKPLRRTSNRSAPYFLAGPRRRCRAMILSNLRPLIHLAILGGGSISSGRFKSRPGRYK